MGKLSMIWQMKKEAERDFTKFVKYVAELEEENRKLKEEIDNWLHRETDLRNRRADSLLENKDLRDKIEELEQDYDRLKVAFEDVVSWK